MNNYASKLGRRLERYKEFYRRRDAGDLLVHINGWRAPSLESFLCRKFHEWAARRQSGRSLSVPPYVSMWLHFGLPMTRSRERILSSSLECPVGGWVGTDRLDELLDIASHGRFILSVSCPENVSPSLLVRKVRKASNLH